MCARLLLVFLATVALPALAQTGGYVNVSVGAHGPPLNGHVRTTVVGSDGHLYAGGDFTHAGATVLNHVARWDGQAWQPLGAGTNAPVHTLVVGPDGQLYAGGAFSQAGGIAVHRTARWDGTAWGLSGIGVGGSDPVVAIAFAPGGRVYVAEPWGIWRTYNGTMESITGTSSGVRTLVVAPDGTLYAGGYFSSLRGVAANRVARWDGQTWHPLGAGIGSNYTESVLAMDIGADGHLYAGGNFAVAGGAVAKRVARWDGSAWHTLGEGLDGLSGPSVTALDARPDGSVYVAGRFLTAGGTPARHLARWDGAAWHAVSPGSDYALGTLAVAADGRIYAAGQSQFYIPAFVMQWTDTAGTLLGSAFDGIVRVVVRGPDGALYAGGSFQMAGDTLAAAVARWDGSRWHPLGAGIGIDPDGDGVQALAFGPDGSLYAGGSFFMPGAPPAVAASVARWDGQAWLPMGSGLSSRVRALAVTPDGTVYAGGSFDTGGGAPTSTLARWDGTAWRSMGLHGTPYGVYALAVGPDGSLYAGGYYQVGNQLWRIGRWDGTAWHPLGSGVNDQTYLATVHALAFGPDGHLYAGGRFDTAGGVPAGSAARWDGTSWHALGQGPALHSGAVLALSFGADGGLYAGGTFTRAGGAPGDRLARWNGTAWGALTGPDGPVHALVALPSGPLLVGGDFQTAAGVRSPYVVLLESPQIVAGEAPPATARTLTLGPNPARGAATAWISVTGNATVTVHDALGRLVATPFDGAVVGRTTVRLPEGLPPGVYSVRLAAGDAVETAQLIVVR